MDNILLSVSLGIFIIAIGVFFFVPDHGHDFLSFSGEKFFSGEVWRIVTFNFVHVDVVHLIGNVIALFITTLLAIEVGFTKDYFLLLFFVSSMFIALIEGLILPTLIIAGASLGLYSVLGGVSYEGRRLIPIYIFVPLIGFSIFLNPVFSSTEKLVQSIFHFFGFISGLVLYFAIVRFINTKRRSILEVA